MRPPVKQEVTKSHEIPLELLSPDVGSSQARDPFDLKAKQGKAADGTSLTAKKGGAKEADINPESPVAIAAREAATKRAAAEKAAQELRDALKGLVLNGTYVSSKRSVAVISGQLYAEGQPVKPVDGKSKSVVVSKITPHKVVVVLGTLTAELSYLNPPPKAEKGKEKENPPPAARQAVAPNQPPA